MRPPIQRERLLQRFLRYVQVATTADSASRRYPSSEGQLVLGRILLEELQKMGIEDAQQDVYGLVWGTVPATIPQPSSTIAFIAHLDTSPEAPGENVRPQVIENYFGGDIVLPSGLKITVEQTQELSQLVGCTLITTDGTTLLGGDDKAGVAIIMELVHHLMENPHLPHGPIRVLFTCDEEIGHGVDHISLEKLGAVAGYTLDGGESGKIDVETFSADGAIVRFKGINIHPSIGKGRMVNAVRAAGEFISRLPRNFLSPESTEGKEGFIHPYDITGSVAEARVDLILRSFTTEDLAEYASLLRRIGDDLVRLMPGLECEVETFRQYRNLASGLANLPLVVDLAEEAFKNLGRPVTRTIVRGGTDGSRLTEMGLPTPNLSSGQHNIHSLMEFACLDQMVEAVEHLVELADLWQQRSRV